MRATNPADAEIRRLHPWPKVRPNLPIHEHGWFGDDHRSMLGRHLSDQTQVVVELGSWLGSSTRFLLDAAPNACVYAVDHWRGAGGHHPAPQYRRLLPNLYDQFLANLWDHRDRLVPMRTSTQDGILELAVVGVKPDLVYLDADHATESVLADIDAVVDHFPTAVLIGDDWRWDSVREAVERYCREHGRITSTVGNVWRLEQS